MADKAYEDIDFEAFKVESVEAKDLNISLFEFDNNYGIRLEDPKGRYTALLFFQTKPMIKSRLLTSFAVLPKEPIKYALVIDNESERNFLFEDSGCLNETKKTLDYSIKIDNAEINVFTNLDGRIYQFDFWHELKNGGMKEKENFAKKFKMENWKSKMP
jgi:hypothetical protein